MNLVRNFPFEREISQIFKQIISLLYPSEYINMIIVTSIPFRLDQEVVSDTWWRFAYLIALAVSYNQLDKSVFKKMRLLLKRLWLFQI